MTGIQDTLNAIKEAAAALDREPGHLANIEELQRKLAQSEQHAQTLEIGAIGFKGRIEALEAQVRSLEVERDDASFRLLETEDRLAGVVTTIQGAITNLKASLPSEPTSQPSPEPVAEAPREEAPVSVVTGQSETNPTPAQLTENQSTSVPSTVESMDTVLQDPHPVQATETSGLDPIPGRYAGKKWSEVKTERGMRLGPTYDEWTLGGGTDENYWA